MVAGGSKGRWQGLSRVEERRRGRRAVLWHNGEDAGVGVASSSL